MSGVKVVSLDYVVLLWLCGLLPALGGSIPSLKPGHLCQHNWAESYNSIQPEEYDSPYSLDINQSKYILGRTIQVTLSGTQPFRGFVLQARRFNLPTVQGHFRSDVTGDTSLSECVATDDTLSAWLVSPRTNLTATWVAPDADVGTLHFVATVFKDQSHFWTNITSHSFRKGFTPIVASECGKTKGCFRFGESQYSPCTPESCIYMVTFKQNISDATFEITTSAGWAAIGFSSDQDMHGDDVIMCLRNAAGPHVAHFYTTNRHQVPTERSSESYTNQEVEFADGRLSCRVTRPLKIYEDSYSVDLNNDWYQLYAWGPMSYGSSPLMHSLDSPPTSEYKVTLSSKYDVISRAASLQCAVTSQAALLILICMLNQR